MLVSYTVSVTCIWTYLLITTPFDFLRSPAMPYFLISGCLQPLFARALYYAALTRMGVSLGRPATGRRAIVCHHHRRNGSARTTDSSCLCRNPPDHRKRLGNLFGAKGASQLATPGYLVSFGRGFGFCHFSDLAQTRTEYSSGSICGRSLSYFRNPDASRHFPPCHKTHQRASHGTRKLSFLFHRRAGSDIGPDLKFHCSWPSRRFGHHPAS